ncbi:MAG: hypothetical protein Q9217_001533 [Psora testacea]
MQLASPALRERLLATVQSHHIPEYQQHRPEHQLSQSSAPNPHNHNIDPAIAGTGMMNPHAGADGSGGDETPDVRRGKRELSTSKRAAQNRAAQRAFRQRKEGHIKTLENQVREFNALNESYKAIQAENYTLREYIISLQGRLLEAQGEYPPPPAHIDLQSHRNNLAENNAPAQANPSTGHEEGNGRAPTATMSFATNELQVSATQAMAKQRQPNEDAVRADAGPNKRMRMVEESEESKPPNGLPTSAAS